MKSRSSVPLPTVILSLLVTAGILFLLMACATKYINGRRVVRTQWINGQIVYTLEGDKAAEKWGVDDMKKAGKGIMLSLPAPKPEKQKAPEPVAKTDAGAVK